MDYNKQNSTEVIYMLQSVTSTLQSVVRKQGPLNMLNSHDRVSICNG